MQFKLLAGILAERISSSWTRRQRGVAHWDHPQQPVQGASIPGAEAENFIHYDPKSYFMAFVDIQDKISKT